jgi:hypothetical protein
MDMEFVTQPSWEPARMDMGISIEPKMDNTGKEENGGTFKYRIGKIKGAKNCICDTRTLILIIIKL